MTFEQWRFEVWQAINAMGRDAYLDKSGRMQAIMHATNYDPAIAAQEWLRAYLYAPSGKGNGQ